ncbi:13290_t:CDS:2, partial [Cetraspora pellucida]
MSSERGTYHEEFQDNATFRKWDCMDNIFDALYNNSQVVDISTSSNVPNNMNQTDYKKKEMENLEGHQHYELQEGLMFHNWKHAMNEIKKYEKRKGFRTCCYHIEKLKNEEKNITFTTEMTKDIKFFVTKINCSPQQICKALEEKYFVKVYMPVLRQKEVDPQWYVEVDWDPNNPALVTTIHDEFPTTNALHCIFYIAQNISLNLKNYLKDNYDEFISDFFEKCLLDKYNNKGLVNYLQWLYANKESWAKAFVLKLFMAGMSSTLQVKSYNTKIKRLIFNSNTTILELAEKLMICVFKEDKKTEYALLHVSVPKAALVVTADSILPNVCKMLCKYLTTEMLKIQEDQIKQSLQYHAMIVVQEKLQKFLIVNLDNFALFGKNFTDIDIIAKSMLDLIDTNKVMLYIQAATFHIQLIRSRWYNETSSDPAQESFLVAQKFGLEHNSNVDSNSASNSESEDDTDKIELDPKELMNPHKRKDKGQLKRTNRIRYANEPPKK